METEKVWTKKQLFFRKITFLILLHEKYVPCEIWDDLIPFVILPMLFLEIPYPKRNEEVRSLNICPNYLAAQWPAHDYLFHFHLKKGSIYDA